MNNQWINAVGVLKPATLKHLAAKVGRQGQLVVDGWAATNPKQVKVWETDGSLLSRAVADQLANPGMPALAPHESNEIYGGPSSAL